MNPFLALLQSWESGILLRALGPEEHRVKKAVPRGKKAGGCCASTISSDRLCLGQSDRKVVLRKFGHSRDDCELGEEVNEWILGLALLASAPDGVAVCVLDSNKWTSWEEAVDLRVHGMMVKGTCAA